MNYFPFRGTIASSSLDDQTTVSNFGAYIVGGTTNNGTAFQGDGLLLVGGGARLKIAANGKIGRYKNGTWEDI